MQHRLSSSAATTPTPRSAGASWGSQAAAQSVIAAARKMDCGWYGSSFDLARGLDIVEQDDDALYQLWALARH